MLIAHGYTTQNPWRRPGFIDPLGKQGVEIDTLVLPGYLRIDVSVPVNAKKLTAEEGFYIYGCGNYQFLGSSFVVSDPETLEETITRQVLPLAEKGIQLFERYQDLVLPFDTLKEGRQWKQKSKA